MASTMAVEMAYRSPPPPFAVAVRNLTQMAEEVYDGALGCGILQGPDYSEAIVSRFNPDVMAEADKTAAPRADLHGYATVGDIMRGLNPVSRSLWQSCLGASKVGLKMVSLLPDDSSGQSTRSGQICNMQDPVAESKRMTRRGVETRGRWTRIIRERSQGRQSAELLEWRSANRHSASHDRRGTGPARPAIS